MLPGDTAERVNRNALCPCGSGAKFKNCHGRDPRNYKPITRKQYCARNATPIRWLISNELGRSFFSNADNRILVFTDKQIAVDLVRSYLFNTTDLRELQIADIDEASWQSLRETVPFIEVSDLPTAIELVSARINGITAKLEEAAEAISDSTGAQST